MAHPFEPGKMYRNRAGEYTVVGIDGDRMTIRYVSGSSSGSSIVTSVATQARIWENIQFEEQSAREEERLRLAQEARLAARKRAAKPAQPPAETPAAPKARGRFTGFQESDFQPKARGIAWPGRVALGGLLANELSRRTGQTFNKWLVPLQPEVHVARAQYYDAEAGSRNSAFFAAVSEKGAAYGFRVGKPDGRIEPGWPWSATLGTLAADEDLRAAVESVMRDRNMSLDVYAMDVVYGPVSHVTLAGDAFLWERETAAEAMSREMNWNDLLDYLNTLAPEARVDIYLRCVLSNEDAVTAGPGIARDMVSVFTTLLPLYDASTSG